jgi:prepilin-type N-terminal cleavage/methylation domain-containing protein
MNTKQTTKGFTIIEVVLVLAIAGLIFLMVFVALPALQRGQRDSARKNDVGTVASAITSYQANNKGKNPSAAQIGEYINNGSGTLDSGLAVSIQRTTYDANRTISAALDKGTASDANTLYQDQIKVFFGFKCGTTSTSIIRGSVKQAAVLVALEAGPAGGTVYCQTT